MLLLNANQGRNMTGNKEQMHRRRETLAALRVQLKTLEQEYNQLVPPDGGATLGRRARLAHQKILTEIASVKLEIQKCEKELGDA